MDNLSPQQVINCIPLLKYLYFVSILSDYVPILPYENFAVIIAQRSNMQGEFWLMGANSRNQLFFAEFFGGQRYSFLKHQFK